ncbi:TetR/AcrR family transcriptional regulator [Myxococcota bacterium]
MGMIARQQWEKEQRRTHILRAAEQVFGGKSAAFVTMDEIAHQANLGKGTLYLYFTSKDELCLEIANRFVSEMLEHLKRSAKDGFTGRDRMGNLLASVAEFVLTHRDRFRVAVTWLTSESSGPSANGRLAEYRRLFGQLFGALADAVDAGKKDGSVGAGLGSGVLATELLGALFGTLSIELNAARLSQSIPTVAPLEGMSVGVVRLMLAGLSHRNGAEDSLRSLDSTPVPEAYNDTPNTASTSEPQAAE